MVIPLLLPAARVEIAFAVELIASWISRILLLLDALAGDDAHAGGGFAGSPVGLFAVNGDLWQVDRVLSARVADALIFQHNACRAGELEAYFCTFEQLGQGLVRRHRTCEGRRPQLAGDRDLTHDIHASDLREPVEGAAHGLCLQLKSIGAIHGGFLPRSLCEHRRNRKQENCSSCCDAPRTSLTHFNNPNTKPQHSRLPI